MKKISIVLFSLITILLLVPNIVFGTSNYDFEDYGDYGIYDSVGYESYDYYIQNYEVKMNVNEDNSFDITETLDVFFNVPKHGIIRNIPLKNSVKRSDGSTSNRKVRISNIDVNEQFTKSKSNGNQVIKIGKSSSTVLGKQQYVISYKYDIGKDSLKDVDELYFNIIGTEWDTAIERVSFEINMPKEFDQSKLGFSAGTYGTEGTTGVSYLVMGNTITGEYSYLGDHEGVTVRLELPEGYFVNKIKFQTKTIIAIIASVIFTIIGFIIWSKYGKDEKPVETVEFYPPEGLNSLDVSYIYKGKVERQDIVSLLIYLANKGYLKVEEEDGKGLLKKKTFKIIKVKDYDGDNPEEKEFFNGLFRKKDIVTKSDLEYSFYTTINKIVKSKGSKENKDLIYDKKATKKRMIMIPFIIIMAILATGVSLSMILISVSFLFEIGIFVILLGVALFGTTSRKSTVGAIIATIIVAVVGYLIRSEEMYFDTTILIEYIFEITSIAIMLVLYGISTKNTEYATEMLGKIQGFKNFLETSEKEKLEELVNQDPQYFYNILPYTYVLGVSDKWMKKFESITIEPPNWYYGYSTYDYVVFNHFMRSTYTSMSSAMTSTPSSSGSSGGGGFSGGGFSGGGFGGGGGSSW